MATASGERPTTTNAFCSPAFDLKGVEQRVAIAPIATRLRVIGGIDIILRPRESGTAVRLRVIAMEGWEGEVRYYYSTLPLLVSLFRQKASAASMGKINSNQ